MDDSMNKPNAIIPVEARKTYRIGDGSARIARDDERPLTGEEKYQKPLHEAMADFNESIGNFMDATIKALEPGIQALMNVARTPEFQDIFGKINESNRRMEAQERSREDVKRKRKDMMKRRGRR